jgi:hypothetical protein
MTDLIFSGHKNRESGKSVKIRSAVGKTKNTTDQQTDR